MGKQVRVPEERQRSSRRDASETRPPSPEVAGKELAKRGKRIKEEADKILDEIEDVLEENAEEFVKNYVQRGGE